MNDKDIIAKLGSINMDKVDLKLKEKSQRSALIDEAVQICMENGSLNAAETGFIESVEDMQAKGQPLSEKQYNWLMAIMEKSL